MRTGNNTTNNRQQRVVRYAYYYINQVCQVFFFLLNRQRVNCVVRCCKLRALIQIAYFEIGI